MSDLIFFGKVFTIIGMMIAVFALLINSISALTTVGIIAVLFLILIFLQAVEDSRRFI